MTEPVPTDEAILNNYLADLRAEVSRLTSALSTAEQERDEAKAEIAQLRGARLLSILFGHHAGAPKAFALQRREGHALVALGAEFPDGAVALRLAGDGGWTTTSTGGAAQFDDRDTEILWLTEELESLAEMEQRAERAEAEIAYRKATEADLRAELERTREVVEAATRLVDAGIQDRHSLFLDLRAEVDALRTDKEGADGT